jgi:TolA-binding protein
MEAMLQQRQLEMEHQHQLEMEALIRKAKQRAEQQQPKDQKPKPPPSAVPAERKAEKPVSAPPVVTTPEERAASKYKMAMRLAEEGKPADAAEYCTEILEKYPDTSAAEQAKAYLEKSGKR